MKELIIKVDDPGERAWDGSPKTFEIQELIRCKDCKFLPSSSPGCHMFCERIYNFVDADWFCADGERRKD